MPENELNARIRTPPPKWLLALAAFVAGAGLELGGATRPLLARFFFIVAAIVTYWEIWARSKNFRSAERKIVRASSAPALIIATLLAAQYLAPNPEPTENIVQQVLNGVEALFKKYATEKPVATEPVPKQPPERPAPAPTTPKKEPVRTAKKESYAYVGAVLNPPPGVDGVPLILDNLGTETLHNVTVRLRPARLTPEDVKRFFNGEANQAVTVGNLHPNHPAVLTSLKLKPTTDGITEYRVEIDAHNGITEEFLRIRPSPTTPGNWESAFIVTRNGKELMREDWQSNTTSPKP